MGQSAFRRNTIPFQGAIGDNGHTAVVVVLPLGSGVHEDKITRLRASVIITDAAGGHLNSGWRAMVWCVVINKTGVYTVLAPLNGGANPVNSNTAGAEIQGDAGHATSTAIWTIVGNQVILTLTNANAGGNAVAANYTAFVDEEFVGSI